MPTIAFLNDLAPDMIRWRRALHAHPQTAFEETFASDMVAQQLERLGMEVHRGLATTGVVGVLEGGLPSRGGIQHVGLRADMDALDIAEQNEFEHKSQFPGKMHACGHDGHTAMLLGAATYLARTRRFSGIAHFIFQPAEENEGGGRVMIEEGLFERFPCDAVFGLHNMPGLRVGKFAVRPGPIMAAFDVFEAEIRGRGTHAAMPHMGVDPIVAAGHVITALQTIVSRGVSPLDRAVVSVTQVQAGDTWNVLPETARIRGTVRTFREPVQQKIENDLRRLIQGVCEALGAEVSVRYQRRYPATINSPDQSEWAAMAAADVVGDQNVLRDPPPGMGSEDFAFMLQRRPGSYAWIGNGPTTQDCRLHSPRYDFNDEILPLGDSYWAKLVENVLG